MTNLYVSSVTIRQEPSTKPETKQKTKKIVVLGIIYNKKTNRAVSQLPKKGNFHFLVKATNSLLGIIVNA